MERDYRRGPGQWKGCHLFRDIICNGDLSKTRHGALQMGHTYYYYYEVDGSTETYDQSMPSTTTCPYMPGQTVNTLTVPTQQTLRQRSVSLSSMRITDYTTMNPDAKFLPPQPMMLPSMAEGVEVRKRTAPALFRPAAPRSRSPSPAWKRFFHHKSKDDERGRSRDRDEDSLRPSTACDDNRSAASSSRSRNRSISPESLRRFLTEDPPSRPGSNRSERPTLVIPEDIAEENEENEDDDNFATSAISEYPPFAMGLSPPPAQRPTTPRESAPLTSKNLSSLTLATLCPPSRGQDTRDKDTAVCTGENEMPSLEIPTQAPSTDLTSAASSVMASPLSALTPDEEMLTFYDDSNDEDEEVPASGLSVRRKAVPLRSRFTGYSLPQQGDNRKKFELQATGARLNPPSLVAEPLSPADTLSKVLLSPVDTGLDDFLNELGLIVDTVGTKDN
ncbi:unnamed protein product [Clonostachys rosea f. rosea IK726]|uniref:Uncharacterized protein n=1 Tax=Clonostachys rosea f. rosea IK726 TaxID=1349383 RepID=A0ACA9TMA0_BIOOC|nr:unnamed protein product [Clonostachys rosea f. rosea IK726]